MQDTKQRILDTAELLFADHGYDNTSLRRIVSEAGVNLAAVHYHFGSKEALLEAVVLRRATPMNQERLRLLQGVAANPGLEEVLWAFLRPTLDSMQDEAQGGLRFGRLIARLQTEASGRSVYTNLARSEFTPVILSFLDVLRRALPELPLRELLYRLSFISGAISQTLRSARELEVISGGLCPASDPAGAMERLVDFAIAGLRAPVRATAEPPLSEAAMKPLVEALTHEA